MVHARLGRGAGRQAPSRAILALDLRGQCVLAGSGVSRSRHERNCTGQRAPRNDVPTRSEALHEVATGREFLSIPGPTNIPDAVLRPCTAGHRHLLGRHARVTRTLHEDLPKIFRTSGQTYIYAANGHGGWEAAVSNVLSRGETVLVLESGSSPSGGAIWRGCSGSRSRASRATSGARSTRPRLRSGSSPTPAHEIKAVLVVQIDTASGVVNDIHAIRQAMDQARHPALLMVDGRRLARLHAVRDGRVGRRCGHGRLAEGTDDAPGSGLRRRQRARALGAREGRPPHALLGLDLPAGARRTTRSMAAPRPKHLLFALRKALDLLLAEGLDCAALGVTPCSRKPRARPSPGGPRAARSPSTSPEPTERANSITNVLTPGRDPQPLLDYCREAVRRRPRRGHR